MKPVLPVSATSRRALYLLGLLAAVKAAGLVLLATGIAAGIAGLAGGGPDWGYVAATGVSGALLRSLAMWAQDTVAQRAAAGVKDELRSQLTNRVLEDGGSVPGMGSGSLSVLLTRGLDGLDNYYAKYLPALVTCAVVPLLVGARILAADWISAVVIVLTVPLVPVFMVLIGLHTGDKTAKAIDALNRLSDNMLELAKGLPVLVGLGRAQAQTRALRDVADRYRKTTLETLRVAFLSSLALELIATISVAVVAVFIGVRLVHGDMPLEMGLLALILAPECYQPLRDLGTAHHASEDGLEALKRTNAVLDAPAAKPLSRSANGTGHTAGPGLSVRGLTVRYPGRAEPVLKGLEFTVPQGSIAALTGPSGSGKTTVLEILAGLRRSGSGTEISGAAEGIDRDAIAWIPQHPVLVEDTVEAELGLYSGLADPGERRRAARRALAEIGAAHLLEAQSGDLSPGEQRRVAVARAIARIQNGSGVRVLLADEPTAHLDSRSAAAVRAALSRLRGHCTVLLVAHDPETAALADTVISVSGSVSPAGVLRQAAGEADPAPLRQEEAQVPAGPAATDTQGIKRQPLWKNLLILRPWSPRFLQALAYGTGATIFAVALSALSGWLIVRASEQPPILYLLTAIVGVRFFGIGRAVLRYRERLHLHDAVFRATNSIRIRLWNGLLNRPEGWRRLSRGGGALERLVGDVDELRDIAPRVVFAPLTGFVTAAAACAATWILVPEAIWVQIGLCLIGLVGSPLLAHWADASARARTVTLQSRAMAGMTKLLAAAPDLEGNSSSGPVLERQRSYDSAAAHAVRRSAWAQGLANAVTALACAGSALWIMTLAQDAPATVAAVIVLMQLALLECFAAVNGSIQQLGAWRILGDKVLPDLGSSEVDPGTAPEAGQSAAEAAALDSGRTAPRRAGSLELHGIHYRYPGAAADVLDGVDLVLKPGDWLAVTGESGSGKSTLLGVLLGFLEPQRGTFLIDGEPASDFPREGRGMAWCPQEAHLFDSTLRGNLLLARDRSKAPSTAEMLEVLDAVGLGQLIAGLEDGLDTRIGNGGHFLSGGQRQRLAVARALLTEADVVLLDEPTAHLDPAAGKQLMADLRSGLSGKSVVVVTHNPADAAWCSRRLELGSAQRSLAVR
ncbi:thiol reductant ABC exporter subunit CydD [Arthrobacter sp. Sa2BUA2]|uniref:Thiol reductant ABC exporter subunit CydD n=1 Tax=Arthrobacter pullicola TaxID=2762224 RepID=A0ABR8YLB6_9MICC|nr:thiol reductant ABC exporter subunit CydD [Arthrobacter pullicola]MBD8045020.1 thiol reductant ABC exporter subunit CydD [Arthrobacter pullicola]